MNFRHTAFVFLLCLTAYPHPAWAVKPPKQLPQALKATPQAAAQAANNAARSALSAAHQQALQHAAALRKLNAAKPPAPAPKTPTIAEQEALVQQQKLAELEKRISALQTKSLLELKKNPIWHRTLEQLPARKTPQMWLRVFEDYVLQFRKFPKNAGNTMLLYHTYMRLQATLPPEHPVMERLQQLRKQYPPERQVPKLPQTYADELEAFTEQHGRLPSKASKDPTEKNLYKGVYNVLARLGPNDPISQRIRHTLDQYPSSYKSPQEWADLLDKFVAQYHRMPSRYAKDPQEKALCSGVTHVLKTLDAQHPIAQRINQLLAPYRPQLNTPQMWVDKLVEFEAQYHRLPSRYSQDPQEKKLQKGIANVLKNHPADDPLVIQIRNFKRAYDPAPARLLERVTKFVAQYERFPAPSVDGQEDKLYWDIKKMLDQLPAYDPVAVNIRQLQLMYANAR